MRAIISCALASVMYAAEIVIADRYLRHIAPSVMTFCLGLGVAICALPFALYNVCCNKADVITMPTGREWILIAAMVIVSFAADWAHFVALKANAGATILATFYLMIPVICTMMKGEVPPARMLCAWALLGVALFLVKEELLG